VEEIPAHHCDIDNQGESNPALMALKSKDFSPFRDFYAEYTSLKLFINDTASGEKPCVSISRPSAWGGI